MAIEAQIQIYIDGKQIPGFISIALEQEIDAHHSFELVCRTDVLENFSSEFFGDSKNFLGEKFVLMIQPNEVFSGNKELHFKGVVTSISAIKGFYHGAGDLIKIIGKSSSIISDDGPHYTSHMDINIADIIEKTFREYNSSLLELKISPENRNAIHYSVQHNESSFQYASRLASQYGEWFYYDGMQLVFGKPQNKEATSLVYGVDLLELSMSLHPIPNSFKYITNDYYTDSYHETKTKEIHAPTTNETGFVNEKRNLLYPKETQVFMNAYDDPMMKSRMDDQITRQKRAKEANQVKVTGISSNPSIQIGGIVKIKGEDSFYGNYRIIKISHTCDQNGSYENTFEAIPEEMTVYPKTSIQSFPKSKSQTGVVINNNDPEGLGRVQVQHAWQKSIGETTPWVRLSNTAGGAGQGFFFVPEVGDEVIVDYEGGNAESPYVQGSMYNSSSVPDSFKSGNNHLKAIKSRSGNQITLNDADGSITIADPSGNTISMGGNGEITINAPNKITFSSTDIAIEASNNITLNGGNDITANASNNMNLDGGNNLSAKAGVKASLNGTKSASVFGKRVSITASVMANIQSGAILTIITAGVLNVTGAVGSFLNGAKVKILGGKVEIN
ncbi:type VI secretion system Vgr family protein [Aquimarina longa]|uniref:type VI secretion system Vgr family protein n=1 Tax=Aquimarina longa TaxID=1080221 RepID=UPI0007818B03|nr:phage baseplate assembly protein V [Aquimarina longa]